ncbi:Secreted protein [Streptantibioticus cattleyicolor NRRL 8057 = DSM 46488]|nr:Secreted protein [Streptantibioticus cattleyicolor NRRL 8057 = DSM 46488]
MGRTRRTGRAGERRAATVAVSAAFTVLAVVAFAAVGCGGPAGGSPAPPGTSAPAPGSSGARGTAAGGRQPLATIKGTGGVVVTIDSATRDPGGFVTVTGQVRNTGTEPFTGTSAWRGDEEELQKNGGSLAGATLVDTLGRKRYYVLRDTEGRCLCTTGLDVIRAGASLPVYAQFPAPPATTTQVDFDLPTLPPASIVLGR